MRAPIYSFLDTHIRSGPVKPVDQLRAYPEPEKGTQKKKERRDREVLVLLGSILPVHTITKRQTTTHTETETETERQKHLKGQQQPKKEKKDAVTLRGRIAAARAVMDGETFEPFPFQSTDEPSPEDDLVLDIESDMSAMVVGVRNMMRMKIPMRTQVF